MRVAHKRRRRDLKHAEEGKRSLSKEEKLDLRRARDRIRGARSREGRRQHTASLELIVHRQGAEITSLKQELLDRSASHVLAMQTQMALRETLKLLLERDIGDADLSPDRLPLIMCEVVGKSNILNSASESAFAELEKDVVKYLEEGFAVEQPKPLALSAVFHL